ncbi:uncharacterized protein LOC100370529 [Saccoglossus kowalevskii]|uniref:Uncharacterized protein LOC100370529 n=1 Tax=Saccoglossus kowalevskii TaxID=10224 RepID=A0ABM0GXK1_SACKO|nr:PREDICTED: uncharacterized protein LOC100370529 [Saccoglossus kowalevskii]
MTMCINLRYVWWWQFMATALFTNITLCLGQRISDTKGRNTESPEENIGNYLGIDLEKNNNLLILILSVAILLIFIITVLSVSICKRKGCFCHSMMQRTNVAVIQASGTRQGDSDLPPSYCHCVREGIIASSDSFIEGLWGTDCANYLPDYETVVADRSGATLQRNNSVSDVRSEISSSSVSLLIRETSGENEKSEQPCNLEIHVEGVDNVHGHVTIAVTDIDPYQHCACDATAENVTSHNSEELKYDVTNE